MAEMYIFFDHKNDVIAELTPMPNLGDSAHCDVEKGLLQTFVNACADAGEHIKPRLRAVCLLSERFSGINIGVDEAMQRIQDRPKEFSALRQARENMPDIFNWYIS